MAGRACGPGADPRAGEGRLGGASTSDPGTRGSRGCRGGTRCPSRCRDFNRTPLTPAAGQYILKQSTATLNAYLRDRVRVSEPSLQHEASVGGSTSSMTCMRSRPRRQRRNAPASKMSTSPGWLSDGRGLMSLFTRAASCSSTSTAGLDGHRGASVVSVARSLAPFRHGPAGARGRHDRQRTDQARTAPAVNATTADYDRQRPPAGRPRGEPGSLRQATAIASGVRLPARCQRPCLPD